MPHNIAFLDGQNLYMGTHSAPTPWKIDFFRLRRYLKEKYTVEKAYYYIGYMLDEHSNLYTTIQEAGFILRFRKHNSAMQSLKKGNVDSDIIFDIMKKLYKKEVFNKILLVSGDGDFRMVMNFLLEENRLKKILFPNQKYASSLYNKISPEYFDNLDTSNIRKKNWNAKKTDQ